MIYKPFFRDDLGYKPRYTQPLHLEEVVVSPIYDSENGDSEIDINSLGYKPIYKNVWEGVEMNPPKKESVLSYTFQSKEDFKNTMIPIYANILSEKGLNPLFAKSLVAQDGLESAWGSNPSGDNNFGGVKGKGRIKRTREVINGKDVYLDQEFRDFNSLEDYARYKVNLLNGKRYKAFDGGLEDFSRRVSSGGYATDPRYKEILDKVIKSVKKGGRIEKTSLGTIFSTNEPRNQRGSGVEKSSINKYIMPNLSDMYYNEPIDIKPVIPNPFDDRIGKYMDGHTKEKEYESYLPYSRMIKSISKEFGLPEHLLIHLASTESHFDPNALNTETGASGLMQIMPESMAKYKSDGLWRDDLSDAENNIRAGAHILKYFYGVYKDWKKAFMAYKGIAKDKRVPTHPEHDYLIKKNKIDYLMSYVD